MAHTEDISFSRLTTRPKRDHLVIQSCIGIVSGHGKGRAVHESSPKPSQSDFNAGGSWGIGDEAIGHSKCVLIHSAREGNALFSISPPTKILNGGQGAGVKNLQ
jgi:hypothetical protein